MNGCKYLDKELCNDQLGCYWFNTECTQKSTSCGKYASDKDEYRKVLNKLLPGKNQNVLEFKDSLLNLLFVEDEDYDMYGTLILKLINTRYFTIGIEETYVNLKPNLKTDFSMKLRVLYSQKTNLYLRDTTVIDKNSISTCNGSIQRILFTDIKEIIYRLVVIISSFVSFLLNKEEVINKDNIINIHSEKNVLFSELLTETGLNSYTSLLKNFENIEVIKRTSASSTLQVKADLIPSIRNSFGSKQILTKPNKFFFKIFCSEPHIVNIIPQLIIEASMYNELYKLVKFNITPHIITKIVSGKFNNFDTEFYSVLPSKIQNDIRSQIIPINKYFKTKNSKLTIADDYIWSETGIIISNPGEQTLDRCIGNLNDYELKTIFFQLYYTLYVFEKLQISHGDLHLGNLFVNTIEPTEYIYIIEGKKYKLEVTKLLKIYDFDQSMIAQDTTIRISKNKAIKINKIDNPIRKKTNGWACTTGATCDIYNPKLEMIKFKWDFDKGHLTLKPANAQAFFAQIYYNLYVSPETIGTTYNRILSNPANKVELAEFNRIFNLPPSTPYDDSPFSPVNYGIDQDILNLRWIDYYTNIVSGHKKYGLIVKSKSFTTLNQLWIPDIIIPSYTSILKNKYFDDLLSPTTKITNLDNVYTIDNRII